jgi:periplasmic copper chaperone A
MTKFSLFMAAMTAFFVLSAGQMAAAHDGIRVQDAYARVIGAQAKSGAVFMTVLNHSIEDDRLISVTTDAAERAELHTHTMDANGVMTMGEVKEGFPIAGMETRMLDRGGDHIMLLGLTQAFTPGDIISLTLTFERSGEMVVEVPVDNDRKPAVADHSGHSMPATE